MRQRCWNSPRRRSETLEPRVGEGVRRPLCRLRTRGRHPHEWHSARHDTQAAFATTASWSTFDITTRENLERHLPMPMLPRLWYDRAIVTLARCAAAPAKPHSSRTSSRVASCDARAVPTTWRPIRTPPPSPTTPTEPPRRPPMPRPRRLPSTPTPTNSDRCAHAARGCCATTVSRRPSRATGAAVSSSITRASPRASRRSVLGSPWRWPRPLPLAGSSARCNTSGVRTAGR